MANQYNKEEYIKKINEYLKVNRAKASVLFSRFNDKDKEVWINISTKNLLTLNEDTLRYMLEVLAPKIEDMKLNPTKYPTKEEQIETNKVINDINSVLRNQQKNLIEALNNIDGESRKTIEKFISNPESFDYKTLLEIKDTILPKIINIIDKQIAKKEDNEDYLDKVISFSIEYQIELNKISTPKLDSREKSFMVLLREGRSFELSEKQAEYIYHNLIPILKKAYSEHHNKSAYYLNIIKFQVEKIITNPAYSYIITKINPQDRKLFEKCINDRYSLDQNQLKSIISHTIPLLRQRIKNLSERDKKIIEIRKLVKENKDKINSKLKFKENELINKIYTSEEKNVTDAELDYILTLINNILTQKEVPTKEPKKEVEKPIVNKSEDDSKKIFIEFLSEPTSSLRKTIYEDEILSLYTKETISEASYRLEKNEQSLLIRRYKDGIPLTSNEKYLLNSKILPRLKYFCSIIEPEVIYEKRPLHEIIGTSEKKLQTLIAKLTPSEKEIYDAYINSTYSNLSNADKNNYVKILIPKLRQIKATNDSVSKTTSKIKGQSILTRYENQGLSSDVILQVIDGLDEDEKHILQTAFGVDYKNIMDTKKLSVQKRDELNQRIIPKIKKRAQVICFKTKKRVRKEFIKLFKNQEEINIRLAILMLPESEQEEIKIYNSQAKITNNEATRVKQTIYKHVLHNIEIIQNNHLNIDHNLDDEELKKLIPSLIEEKEQKKHYFKELINEQNEVLIELALHCLDRNEKRIIEKYDNQEKLTRTQATKLISFTVVKVNSTIDLIKEIINKYYTNYKGNYGDIIKALSNIINGQEVELLLTEEESKIIYEMIIRTKSDDKTIYEFNRLKRFKKETIDKALQSIENENYQSIIQKRFNNGGLTPDELVVFLNRILPIVERRCNAIEKSTYNESVKIKTLLHLKDIEKIKPYISEKEYNLLESIYSIKLKDVMPNIKEYVVNEFIPYIQEVIKSNTHKHSLYEIEKITIFEYFAKEGYTKEQVLEAINNLNKPRREILKTLCGEEYNQEMSIEGIKSYQRSQIFNAIFPELKAILDSIKKNGSFTRVYKSQKRKRKTIRSILSNYHEIIFKIACTKLSEEDYETLIKYDNQERLPQKKKDHITKTISSYLKKLCEEIYINIEKYKNESELLRKIYNVVYLNEDDDKINNITDDELNKLSDILVQTIYNTGRFHTHKKSLYELKRLKKFKKSTIDAVVETLEGNFKVIYTKLYIDHIVLTEAERKDFYGRFTYYIVNECEKREPIKSLKDDDTIKKLVSKGIDINKIGLSNEEIQLYIQYENTEIKDLNDQEKDSINELIINVIKGINNINKQIGQTPKSIFKIQEKYGYNIETTLLAISILNKDDQELLQKKYGPNYDEVYEINYLTSKERKRLNSQILPRIRNISKKISEGIDISALKRMYGRKQTRIKNVRNKLSEYSDLVYSIIYSTLGEKSKEVLKEYESGETLNKNQYAYANSVINLMRTKSQRFIDNITSKRYLNKNNDPIISLIIKSVMQEEITPEEQSILDNLSEEQKIEIYNQIGSRKNSAKRKSLYNHIRLSCFPKEIINEAINNLNPEIKELIKSNITYDELSIELENAIKELEIECQKIKPYIFNKSMSIYSLIPIKPKQINKIIDYLEPNQIALFNKIKGQKLINLTIEEQREIVEALVPSIIEQYNLHRKKCYRDKTIIDSLREKGFTEENIMLSIKYLTKEDQELLYLRYGKNLDQNNTQNTSIELRKIITTKIKHRLEIINQLIANNESEKDIKTKVSKLYRVRRVEPIRESSIIKIKEYIKNLDVKELAGKIIISNNINNLVDKYANQLFKYINDKLLDELLKDFTKKDILIFLLCTNNYKINMSIKEITKTFNVDEEYIRFILEKILLKCQEISRKDEDQLKLKKEI